MYSFIPTASFTGLRLRPCLTTSIPTPSTYPFLPHSPPSPLSNAALLRQPPRARVTVTVEKIGNKSYQLEEDEDALSCTSAVYLNMDGTLAIGRTDGPRPDDVDAYWRYNPNGGELLIDIERFFDSESRTPFSVKRVLRGHLDDSRKNLEGLPVFTGAMYRWPADFSQGSEIGWFAMILAVDDLPENDFNISSSQ